METMGPRMATAFREPAFLGALRCQIRAPDPAVARHHEPNSAPGFARAGRQRKIAERTSGATFGRFVIDSR
jgi:hypothetical protein